MKTVFLNPFLPTDLNEKVTSVSFKIGSFDYIAKHANVKTTEIDFDKRIIQINDDLDSTASLRELVRAFFIIVAYELNLCIILKFQHYAKRFYYSNSGYRRWKRDY